MTNPRRPARICEVLTTSTVALALLLTAVPAIAQVSAGEILKDLGFPESAQKSVLEGKVVDVDVPGSNERELAVGMAFLVEVPPGKLTAELRENLLFKADPNALAYGPITGGPADFDGVSLAGAGEDELGFYLDAEPGDDLNLSAEEIAAFGALKDRSAAGVEAQIRKNLLARYEAYRAAGLSGIAPYARGDDESSNPGADLRSASEAASAVKRFVPAFYEILLGYPKADAPGLEERFTWASYRAHGRPVFILTHGFSLAWKGSVAACQRQFYVSGSYNAEQAVAGFFPVKEGTIVVYANRTSTDQVTGFGGSAKRSIGSKVLASQLEKLFHDLQKTALE